MCVGLDLQQQVRVRLDDRAKRRAVLGAERGALDNREHLVPVELDERRARRLHASRCSRSR